MQADLVLSDARDVAAALCAPFVPPPGPASLGPGATARLRDGMARFSAGSDHVRRRQRVDQAVRLVASFPFERTAFERTGRRLCAPEIELVRDIGVVVPCETLGSALGVPDVLLPQVLDDVAAVVAVIGRGTPSSATSDAAAERLADTLGGTAVGVQVGSVPAISLLYQAFDSTSALIGVTVLAEHLQRTRVAAVRRTRRVAAADTSVGSTRVPAGAAVVLDLASAGLEFGAGPHACPGRSIAEATVAGVTRALTSAGYEVVDEDAQVSLDDVPARLRMRQRP